MDPAAGAKRRELTRLPKRLAGAFAGACVVVLALTLSAAALIRLFDDERRDPDAITAHPVQALGYDSVDLAELLDEPRYQLPDLEPPPPALPPATPRAERQVSGFVMVEVTVDAEGRATDARVIDAAPAGVYEGQAVAEALAGRYEAGLPGRRDTVVRFSVPADASAR
ncbi:MAG: TonB family protein [Pseudomonadota bacterium]